MREYPLTLIEPDFHNSISIYENSDPVDADSVDNVPLKQLQENALYLKKKIDDGMQVEEASVDDIQDIINGSYDPYADGEDDTGEIDYDTGERIEEATDEEIQQMKDSYWND